MLYTLRYDAIRYDTILYDTILNYTILYSVFLISCHIAFYYIVVNFIVRYCDVLHDIVTSSFVSDYIVPCRILTSCCMLEYVIPYSNTLRYTVFGNNTFQYFDRYQIVSWFMML